MLLRVIRDLLSPQATLRHARSNEAAPAVPDTLQRRVLNVGGFSKSIAIPTYYDGWRHILLDIDPSAGADIVCDARALATQQAEQFEAVYCSHNLEHYHKHDVGKVLRGFFHVLKPDGFAHVRVPDLEAVFRRTVESKLELEDILYTTRNGRPIAVRDVIYGWAEKIEESGKEFFAHKTGFTPTSLRAALLGAGFTTVVTVASEPNFEVSALAFKVEPTTYQRELLNLTRPGAGPP